MLYSINAVDIHFENIIAAGEYPVIVDLETLFNPTIFIKNEKYKNSALKKAQKEFDDSVLSVGMLPLYMDGELEVGGLGGEDIQISKYKSDKCIVSREKGILIEKVQFEVKPEKNIPVFSGTTQKTTDYLNDLMDGFEKIYCWVLNHKEEYFQHIYDLFHNQVCRFIVRPTSLYSRLLGTSLHQEFSRKYFEREIILYRIIIEQYKEFPKIANSEFYDLLNGDIPYFTFIPSGTEIFDSTGNKIEGESLEPVLEKVKAKIESFSKEDFERQTSYIDASFISKRNTSECTGLSIKKYDNELRPEEWLKTAEEIGDFLVEKMIVGVGDSGNEDGIWNCVTLRGLEEDVWVPAVLSNEMYSGNVGIALFFLYLWKCTGKSTYLDAMYKAAELPMQQLRDEDCYSKPIIGAFTGLAGTIYLLSEITEATGDEEYIMLAEQTLQKLIDIVPNDKGIDVIGGTAGLLAVTLKLAKTNPESGKYNSEIINLMEHLKHTATITEDGMAYWSVYPDKNYSGYAHGNAGIHTYLYKAAKYLNTKDYDELIEKSLNRERRMFNRNVLNWKKTPDGECYSNAWCHGSSGILLSKILLKEEGFKDNIIDDEIKIALDSTIKNGFGNNPTYCHGDLGNLEIIYKAGQVMGDCELCINEMNAFQKLYDDVLKNDWNSNKYRSNYTYGLMVGLAGWGYSMISHYSNHMVSQFLWLE